MKQTINQSETISPLTEQDINVLKADKSGILAIVVLFSIGLLVALVIFYFVYTQAQDALQIQIFAVFGVFALGLYLIVAFFGILRMSKINREIKAGIKKTKTVVLEDYEALTSSASTLRHTANPTSFYFKASGETYKVSRNQYYNFLNGDSIKITFSPILKIVLGIEKAEETPQSAVRNETNIQKQNN